MKYLMNKNETRTDWLRKFVAAALIGVFYSLPAAAETEDVYTVRDVPVDATAGAATEARVIAIRGGRALALRLLLQRLTLEVAWPVLPVLETSEVTVLGAGFEISNERNSPTRYLASITYRFKPKDVRKILQENDIPFSEVKARPMVVLPVFIEGDKVRIFQDDRDWSFAWANRNYAHELVPVKVPLGDLGDVISAPAEAVMTNDFAALSGYAARYGVQDILLARLRQDSPASPVVFEFVRLSPTDTETWTMTLPPIAEEEEEPLIEVPLVDVPGLKVDGVVEDDIDLIKAMMETAIDKGMGQLQEDWKARTIIRFDARKTMVVSARFDQISQWLVIKRAMQATPNITEHRLVALSTGGAHMEWDVVGTPGQLALALEQHDVSLEAGIGDDISGNSQSSVGNPVIESVVGPGRDETGRAFAESAFGESDEDNPWGDDTNPWATEDPFSDGPADGAPAVEVATQDRVEEFGDDFGGSEWSDLEEAAREPVPGTINGGFYAPSDETVGAELKYANPDFWIVRFSPKVEPEVWPTDEGDPSAFGEVEFGETGLEAGVEEGQDQPITDGFGDEPSPDGSY